MSEAEGHREGGSQTVSAAQFGGGEREFWLCPSEWASRLFHWTSLHHFMGRAGRLRSSPEQRRTVKRPYFGAQQMPPPLLQH